MTLGSAVGSYAASAASTFATSPPVESPSSASACAASVPPISPLLDAVDGEGDPGVCDGIPATFKDVNFRTARSRCKGRDDQGPRRSHLRRLEVEAATGGAGGGKGERNLGGEVGRERQRR